VCIGPVIYIYSSRLLIQLKIDDPLDEAPVHFFAGVWGLLLVGLFAKPDNVRAAYPNHPEFRNFGLFYAHTHECISSLTHPDMSHSPFFDFLPPLSLPSPLRATTPRTSSSGSSSPSSLLAPGLAA